MCAPVGPMHLMEAQADFGSPHTGGAPLLLMDGSTHTIATSVDMFVYRAMAGRNDGQVISLP